MSEEIEQATERFKKHLESGFYRDRSGKPIVVKESMSEEISREQAIDYLKFWDEAIESRGDCEFSKARCALSMAITALSAEPMRWIPVEDALPENCNQEVLISLEGGIDIGEYRDGAWHSEWINHYDDGDILAWMPLPKPYQGKESK